MPEKANNTLTNGCIFSMITIAYRCDGVGSPEREA